LWLRFDAHRSVASANRSRSRRADWPHNGPAPARVVSRVPNLPEPHAVQDLAFSTLLYRYFFFSWLFRDVTRGTRLERAAAWRHNRGCAVWLPTYMRRWLVVGLLLVAIGASLEWLLGAQASALFYVPGALSVPVNAVIAVAWVGLRTLPAPT
jgi:hypothetical protein